MKKMDDYHTEMKKWDCDQMDNVQMVMFKWCLNGSTILK